MKERDERTMKEIVRNWFLRGVYRASITMVAIGIAAASTVYAKPHAKKAMDKPANVAAHVTLSGGPVTRMLLVKKEGKEYLVLGSDSSSSVAILDVSEPDAPRMIETGTAATGAAGAELRVVADTLTAFGSSDAGAASEPKEIRSFSGVTSFLADKHGIIYVTNGDGLWIVKTKHRAEADDINPNLNGDG